MLVGPPSAGRGVPLGSSDPEHVDRHGAGTGVAPSGQLVGQPMHLVRERPELTLEAERVRSRPASAAAARTSSHAGSKSRPGCTGGIGSHPSARRPTRANARGSVPHPIQIGTGSGGRGAMPAASTTSDVPA